MRAFVAFAALPWWFSTSAHGECKPAALMSGDPVLVQTLSQQLAANGIETTLVPGCPAVRVRVEHRGDQLHLELNDSFSRLGRRQVRDVSTAAAIVESWTLQEIEQGSMPELAASPTTSGGTSIAPRVAASGLAAMLESSIGDDGSLWLGGAVSGCARLGPTCVGGIARFARDTRSTGETAGVEPRSNELHALATLDVPRTAGSFSISPGLGLGYGWLEITSSHLDIHMLPVQTAHSSHALRADLHVTVTRSFGRGIALYGDLRGDTALVRSEIPAGPERFARAAIGIRVEVR
ncbi:MAG: hypothetical protein WKG01_13800 [Kofleriaceae bacterium]